MGVKVHNTTQLLLTIKDRYLENLNSDLGYYGAIEYQIHAGGHKKIPSSIFTKKMMEEKRAQQIHITGKDKRLIIFREDFLNNKEIFLEIGEDQDLRPRFVKREQLTTPRRFWACFSGAPSSKVEAPFAESGGLTSTGSIAS